MASSQTHGDGEAGDGWLVEVFNAIDSNGSGQLDAKNIREALKAAGLPSSKDVEQTTLPTAAEIPSGGYQLRRC